jgi:hypothetical protein
MFDDRCAVGHGVADAFDRRREYALSPSQVPLRLVIGVAHPTWRPRRPHKHERSVRIVTASTAVVTPVEKGARVV